MSRILYVKVLGFDNPIAVYKNKAMIKTSIFDLDDERRIVEVVHSGNFLHWEMIEAAKQAQLSDMKCVTEEDDISCRMSTILANFAVSYCHQYGKDEKLRQLLLRLKGGPENLSLLSYCTLVDPNDEEIKQALIDSDDSSIALDYCLAFGKDEAMAKRILEDEDAGYMLLYYQHVEEDPRMRQGIIDSEHVEIIGDYCEIFDYDKEVCDLLQRLKQAA